MKLPVSIAAVATLVGAAPVISAQTNATYDSTYFAGIEWRNIGPNRGGRSIGAAGSPTRANEYYFGATGGGLWKTTDAGTTWKPVTDGKIRSSSVGAVAVAESNPDIVYIGMGETEFRGNIMQGDGVYRSVDAGKTWTNIGLSGTQAIARVRVDRKNPDVVYVAALGHPYGPNTERGVFRTLNGGKSWQRILYRNDSTGAVDIVIDPNNSKIIYAALWQASRTPWGMSSGGRGSGLFRSTDGGDSWAELTRNPGMPRGIIGKIGVAVSGSDSKRVYAIIEADSGGVFRSDDGGASWKKVNDERRLRQRAFYYSRIYADPANRDRVYVLNTGFYKSDDGGTKFTTLNPPHGDQHDLWIAPNDPQRMINANDGGANVSINGGTTWTGQEYPTAQVYHVTVTTDFPFHACGAQQDNSTFCVPSNDWRNLAGANDGQGDWFYDVGGGESGYIAVNPANPDIIYAGSQGALLTRYNRRNGQIRDVQVYPRFFSGEPASALPERWQWTYPIIFSPQNSKVIYTSSQHLWKTGDEGQTWKRISPDLTRAEPKTLGESGGPITHDMNGPEIYGTIFTIAPSPLDSMVIWTGSDDGLTYITRDGGKSWKNVTPPNLPPFSRISLIDASPHKRGTAYLAAKRYQLDDRTPYIYRTDDYGASWTKITNGIRADDYAHAIREDLAHPELLYAGTEHGIYVSYNNGSSWQSLSLNLPDVQVSDIALTGSSAVIATHGRSLYVIDDLTAVRDAGRAAAGNTTYLYSPTSPVRRVTDAAFYYYLRKPADTVKVEILDAKGSIVRSFIGTKSDSARARADSTRRDSAKIARADSVTRREAIGAPTGCDTQQQQTQNPKTNRGLNRFAWNLRYKGATTFDCMILWGGTANGPIALPGQYKIRLTANGETQTQPFVVRRDPRLVGVTDADLRSQFALAQDINKRVGEANDAVIRIRVVRDQLQKRIGAAPSPTLAQDVSLLLRQLNQIEDNLYQVRNRSGQDPLNFPIRLNNRLAALQRSVETGDARPTAASYIVFKELSADLDRQLALLDQVLKADLPRINSTLRSAGQPAVSDR
ncbi:MAG TPA: glycosyl hydrolase [Gemmatimonadaceae bacterium]|nr:glycosyl hydrolase [Gemmatimonadaceae bacterium]